MFSIAPLTLNVVTRSAPRPGRFTSGENICIIYCVVKFVGPRPGLLCVTVLMQTMMRTSGKYHGR